MIKKRELAEAINDLGKDVFAMAVRLKKLETKVALLETPKTEKPKRKVGRPRKNTK